MTALNTIAETLRHAASHGAPCAPPRELYPELSVEDAYAIQEMNLKARRSVRIGSKIGLTSRAVQRQLGVAAPDFGGLLDEMLVPLGEPVEVSRLMQPRAEAEIAFVLERDLDGESISAVDVIRATAFVLPAIEIIDSRIEAWRIGYVDTIADNASSGLFVLGQDPIRLRGLDLERCGMTLRKHGRVVSTGAGAASMGHPMTAMRWLARTLKERGRPLKAGQIVLSGALGPVTPVIKGDVIEAEIASIGQVSVRFA